MAPDSIIYLILFSLYEMQRPCHRPITLGSALYTCCDLIAFLFIQTFIPLVRFQIILTLVAIFQRGCGRKWPLKWCFLCGAQEKKKKRQYMKENLRRWGPSLKHGFINTGWQKRSQVPDNEEGVAIFFKSYLVTGKTKMTFSWRMSGVWPSLLTLGNQSYLLLHKELWGCHSHLTLYFYYSLYLFFFFEYMVQEDKCLCWI